jgi:GNAT superfamily N-acetyltransferase
VPLPEDKALDNLEERRASREPFDGAELALRIEELGDMPLSTGRRHDAFDELYAAFTPEAYALRPFPDDSAIEVDQHRVTVAGVIVDEHDRQVVGQIRSDLVLDEGYIDHGLLDLQDEYRGRGFSHRLLKRALPIYHELGLREVKVHAALETGRWLWARFGLNFRDPYERRVVLGWANCALDGLGLEPVATDAPPVRLALLGSEPGGEQRSMKDVVSAVKAALKPRRAGARPWHRILRRDGRGARSAQATELFAEWNRRASGYASALHPDRVDQIAMRNDLTASDRIELGKAIMLTGPDWWGTFDLTSPAAKRVFEAEYNRWKAGR